MKPHAGGKENPLLSCVLGAQSSSGCHVQDYISLRPLQLRTPPTFKVDSSCAPSALENLIDMLAAILMCGLEVLKLLPQILDVSFQF
jgi:hypothetical protein